MAEDDETWPQAVTDMIAKLRALGMPEDGIEEIRRFVRAVEQLGPTAKGSRVEVRFGDEVIGLQFGEPGQNVIAKAEAHRVYKRVSPDSIPIPEPDNKTLH